MTTLGELRKQLDEYVRNNKWHTRDQVMSRMTSQSFLDEHGITKDQAEKLVNDTLWPGEQRKGDVIFKKSKRFDSYSIINKETPFYRLEPSDWRGTSYKITRYDNDGIHPLIKNVTREWGHQYILNKLDPSMPKPKKYDPVVKLNALERPIFKDTGLVSLITSYGNYRKGFDDVSSDARLVVGGLKEGIATDGYMLIKNNKAAEDLLRKHLKPIQDAGLDKTVTFPNFSSVEPKNLKRTWVPFGVSPYKDSKGALILFRDDDGTVQAFDADKLALFLKYFPDGFELQSNPSTTDEPYTYASGHKATKWDTAAIRVNGKTVGALRPVSIELSDKIQEAAGKLSVESSADLMSIEESRSTRSRESDERLTNSLTISPDDPRVERWKRNPGSMDVEGIDTPRPKYKVTKAKSKSRKRKPDSGLGTIR